MSVETYWLISPLVLLGVSGLGWLWLWITSRGLRSSLTIFAAGRSGNLDHE
jgi:hypothetical protein